MQLVHQAWSWWNHLVRVDYRFCQQLEGTFAFVEDGWPHHGKIIIDYKFIKRL